MKANQTDTPIHVQKSLDGKSPSTPEARYVYSNQLKREPGLLLTAIQEEGAVDKDKQGGRCLS